MNSKISETAVLSPHWSDLVQEVIRRILTVVNPRKVILFGSGARQQVTPDSDLDFLVIVRGPAHRRELAQKIYRNLHGVEVPVDIVVVTEEDISKYGETPGLIFKPALSEGQVLYESA
ncbi:MAG: nucleotidyltransferase domain-containing protein [Anaerolineales bacterium]|nr:nucleotidyltransferase domain-containing protein [Anaerolineales bacterium]